MSALQLQLGIDLDGIDAAGAEALCLAAGARAISYTDCRDDAILEPAPGEFRLWPATRLTALFDAGESPEALRGGLAAALDVDPARIHVAPLAPRAWEREWLKDFKTMRFGRRLYIAPRHAPPPADADADADAAIVRLDPGLAFGTGTHPTTALCLEWLDARFARGQTLIDFGCGSGVLALAAAKLGARQVWAYDIDPQALIATRDNAAANSVAEIVTVVDSIDALPPTADVLIANILSGPLCELAPALSARVAANGRIALSGLLAAQAAEVTSAYRAWFDIRIAGQRDDWSLLAGSRHGGALSAL